MYKHTIRSVCVIFVLEKQNSESRADTFSAKYDTSIASANVFQDFTTGGLAIS